MSIIKALLSHSDASGSRSTILKPLTWLLGIILATLLAAFRFSAPAWFCYLLAGIAILAVLLFFFAYVFCLFKDRDALRSESFSLRKMEIEKGLVELKLKADTASKEEKKALKLEIKNAEESVNAMKIAMKSMNKFKSSFAVGMNIEAE